MGKPVKVVQTNMIEYPTGCRGCLVLLSVPKTSIAIMPKRRQGGFPQIGIGRDLGPGVKGLLIPGLYSSPGGLSHWGVMSSITSEYREL